MSKLVLDNFKVIFGFWLGSVFTLVILLIDLATQEDDEIPPPEHNWVLAPVEQLPASSCEDTVYAHMEFGLYCWGRLRDVCLFSGTGGCPGREELILKP